ALATVILAGQIWRDDAQLFLRSMSWEGMWNGIKRHRKFPLYDTWAALLNNISWQLPAFFLSIFFSSEIVGYYALGTRLLRVPMSLIGASIAQVFFQRASEAKSDSTLSLVTENAFRRLVMLTLFPLLLLTITGSDLFIIFLGENWAEAGVYTQILSLWMFFWFISSPFSTLFRVLERQEFSLFINIAIFVTRFIALLIGGILQDARLAIALFAVSGVLVYGYLSAKIMTEAGVPWSTIFNVIFHYVLYFAPAGLILLGLKIVNASSWITITVTAILLLVYLVYVVWNDPQLHLKITDTIAILLKRMREFARKK
ncbi:MAG TPA: lipopolysaccharide biosynthesis protein, partial [Chloroflexi bacterium]|nr:lipopolysaccharide biosynthesis protein [Chloroflexota bacterium]